MTLPEHSTPGTGPTHDQLPAGRAVLIACPATLDLVPVGMRAATLDELSGTYTLSGCPSCASHHEWTPNQAVITDS
jgi:hypothetical protein